MKRSTTASLLLMSVVPMLLTACDDPSSTAPQITSQSYPTVAACTTAGNPQAECQKAFAQAQANATAGAPHYKTRDDCIKEFGPDMCQPHSDAGGSFFMPMMTGFMLSRMLDGGSSNYSSAPLYRQRNGQDYGPRGAYAGSGFSSGSSGWTTGHSSDGAGSRAITASRGGFGSASAARGGWGG